MLYQQRIDVVLAHRATPWQLRRIDDQNVVVEVVQETRRSEPIGYHDVSSAQHPLPADGDQVGRARAATDERDLDTRRAQCVPGLGLRFGAVGSVAAG